MPDEPEDHIQVTITRPHLVKVFEAWGKNFAESPQDFQELGISDPELEADYFLHLVGEVK